VITVLSEQLIEFTAADMVMDVKWIHKGKVQTGMHCAVQGKLHAF